jgi:hypothetical protein
MNLSTMPDERPRQFLSIAQHFGTGSVLFGGHEEIYQLGMQRAAAAAGLEWRILVPRHAGFVPDVAVPCLESGTTERLVESLDAHLRTGPPGGRVVVLYEGSIALAIALGDLARAHPHERFLVNLYRRERTLDAPSLPGSPVRLSVELDGLTGGEPERARAVMARTHLPDNLLLTAETPRRALLARSFGLPVRGVWHLQSELTDLDVSPSSSADSAGPRADGEAPRVLIALSRRQFDAGTLRQVREVVGAVRRLGDAARPIEWVLPVDTEVLQGQRRTVQSLARAGVRIEATEGPLPSAAYAGQFLAADAVWFPKVWPYRVTSSGKALDALVLGCPIVAPAGTAAADAMHRWVPGAPDYGTTEEAIAIFLRLPTLLPTLTLDLVARSDEIRVQYSAAATVSWLTALLSEAGRTGSDAVGSIGRRRVHTSNQDRSLPREHRRLAGEGVVAALPGVLAAALAAFRRYR